MITNHKTGRLFTILTATTLGFGGVASAQATHHGFLHRHAGAIAGVSAYAAARHTGRHRIATGRRRNFMQRHPMATGVVAGMAAHHWAKKH